MIRQVWADIILVSSVQILDLGVALRGAGVVWVCLMFRMAKSSADSLLMISLPRQSGFVPEVQTDKPSGPGLCGPR